MKQKGLSAMLQNNLHLKRNTAGSSNEISFSVLDAKKAKHGAAEEQDGTSLGRVKLFSLPVNGPVSATPKRQEGLQVSPDKFIPASTPESAVAGSASSSSRHARHASHASHGKVRRGTAVFVAVAALLAVVVYGVYAVSNHFYQDYLNNRTYSQMLNTALADIIEADNIVSRMDACFNELLSAESLDRMNAVQGNLSTAYDFLERARLQVLRAKEGMTSSDDLNAAEQALGSISARKTMLDAGSSIISTTQNYATALTYMEQGWSILLEAAEMARKAAASLTTLEDTSVVTVARDTMLTANGLFEDASEQFMKANQVCPGLTTTPYITYANLRTLATARFASMCSAINDKELDMIATENALYNELDAEAVAVGETLTGDFVSYAREYYEADIEDDVIAYKDAVESATAHDTYLRGYLQRQGQNK